jgi:hypothetical protein
MTPRNRQPYYQYTYVQPAPTGPSPWEIGLSLLVIPFIVVFAGLNEARVFLQAWTAGMRSGLGIGSDDEPLAIRPPVEKWNGKQEPAYVQYLFGPVWRDIRHTATVATGKVKEAVKTRYKAVQTKHFLPPVDGADDRRQNRIIGFGSLLSIAVGIVLAALLVAAASVAQAVVVGALWLVGVAFIYLLRGVDSVLLRIRSIRITCPNPDCFRHVPYPAYRCGECRTVQHDVRPGRYGTLHRICRCGHAMPTLLMLGSYRMSALCPYCSKELEQDAGSVPEIVLPVFGSPAAGKTQFLAALALAVRGLVGRTGGTTKPADDYTEKWYQHEVDEFSRGRAVTKTAVVAQHAYSLRVETAGKARLLKMFDAAGEYFQSGNQIRELLYVQANATFVFVIDPLSLPKVWDALDAERQRQLEPIRARTSPRAVFEETVQTMHGMNVQTRGARLAILVSKADLIQPEIIAGAVGDGDSIRAWLEGPLGQGNLIRAMSHEFASATYFLTAAPLGGSDVHPSIETFATWLLAGEGMKL